MGVYQTRKEAVQAIKDAIRTNDLYAYHVLERIYQNQTQDEQFCGSSQHKNAVEFNSSDAEICTSLVKQMEQKGYLSAVQRAVVRKVLPKYVNQFLFSCIKEGTMVVENGLVFTEIKDYLAYKAGVHNAV